MKTKVLPLRNFLIFVFVCLLQMTIVKPVFSQSQKKTFTDSFRIRFIIAKPWITVIFLLLFSGFTCFVNAQTVVNPEWVRNYSERDSITNIPAAIDANGNIYVTGSTYVIGQNYNVTTIKYNQNGDTVWVRHYNGTANGYDGAIALGLDGSGNILITGRSQGSGTGYDILTLKYNASGTLLWEQRYDGPIHGNDMPSGLALDNSGNVYVTGYSVQAGTTTDFITIKYSSTGVQNWVKTYNGPGNGNDRSIAIYLKNNRVFITGFGYEAGGTYATTTISYLGSNGNQAWIKKYGNSVSIPDAGGCAIAQYGANIFVSTTTGTSGNYDYTTIAYNNANGNQQWLTIYNAYNLNDIVSSATTDNNGNIFVTGRNLNSNGKYEYHTVKYSQSGVQQWVNKQQVNLTNARTVNKITVDTYNMIYVSGEKKPGYNSDMFLCQITQGGNTQWTETYNGQANGDDAATDIVTDNLGRIFLTGQTYNGNAKFDYTTIKYSQSFIYYPPDFNNEPASSSLSFYENRGQIINTNNNLVPDVRYYSQGSNPSLYFTNTILSYVFSRVDTSAATIDTLHRIDQILLNSNPLARIFTNEQAPGYLNYFLAHCPQGITGVEGYKRLFIPNIYPNIDLHYFSNANGIKSYFVVKPGGNPKDIALQFAGAVNAHIEPNGHLTVNSSIGNIEYDVPTAYQVTPSQNIIPLNWTADWQYFSSPNSVFFKTGSYNSSLPLIIQVDLGHLQLSPQNTESLEWSTYFGGVGNETCIDIKTNTTNKVWVGGFGNNVNIPTFVGLYPSITIGQNHCFIAKFDENAHPVWITYFGGTDFELIYEIAIDNDENVYAVGTTTSSDFPNQSSAGINYSTLRGDQDGFFIGFNNQGNVILCDSYIGGDDNDWGFAIDLKQSGTSKIIAIGGTVYMDATNFPVQNYTGAYFQDIMGYYHSGFIMKLDENYNRTWCSLFAGNGPNTSIWITDVAISSTNTIVVCGFTNMSIKASSNPLNPPCGVPIDGSFPDCNLTGAYNQIAYGGGDADLFISEFNTQNQLIWSTFFGGSGEEAIPLFSPPKFPVMCFVERNIYLTGWLTGDLSNFPFYPSITGTFNQTANLTGSDMSNHMQFITKFYVDRSQIWCTSFGGDEEYPGNSIYDICGGPQGTVFLTGTSQPLNPLSSCIVPPLGGYSLCNQSGLNYMETDAINYNSSNRTFITAFDFSDNLLWSTRFGNPTSNSNKGKGVAASNDKLFLTGFSTQINTPLYTLQELSITDPLDYFQPYNAGGEDGTISRFDISDILVNITENNFEQDNQFTVSPNPADNILNITINNKYTSIVEISFYDAIGKKVYAQSSNISSNNVSVDIHELNNGIYLIKCIDNNGFQFSGKFIKK